MLPWEAVTEHAALFASCRTAIFEPFDCLSSSVFLTLVFTSTALAISGVDRSDKQRPRGS